jgi:hypothetical protein
MKTRIFFLATVTCLFSLATLNAQTKADTLAVETACRNYIEGWKDGDMSKIANAVSPELTKRTVMRDREGNSYTTDMSYSSFQAFARTTKHGVRMPDLEPDKEITCEVKIYDITGDFALAKTIVSKYGFFDYCQLAKVDGEWKIINILWGLVPRQNQP